MMKVINIVLTGFFALVLIASLLTVTTMIIGYQEMDVQVLALNVLGGIFAFFYLKKSYTVNFKKPK